MTSLAVELPGRDLAGAKAALAAELGAVLGRDVAA